MAAAVIALNMLNLQIAEQERERYNNDPAYRMEVLQGQEERLRKKLAKDVDRMDNPGWCACLCNPQNAYERHTAQLNDVLESQAQTAPLLQQQAFSATTPLPPLPTETL